VLSSAARSRFGRVAPGRDDAGVRDDDVEPAVAAHGLGHRPLHVVLGGDVGRERRPPCFTLPRLEVDD